MDLSKLRWRGYFPKQICNAWPRFPIDYSIRSKCWDANGNPTAEVEVDDYEDTSSESEDEESIEEYLKIHNWRKPVSWNRTPELYVRRVDITKHHSIPGWHAAILQFPIEDLKIKKGNTYALEPNEAFEK
ncbi:MAG: hypothetical protein GY861_20555, partial [bacterium]|nr:hypothetical protein [bacterium]